MKSLFTRKSLAVVSAFFVASIVTSCHDEEVANIEELSYRHAYERNFVKTFGEIDPNQSWDFSSYARSKRNYIYTRADEGPIDFGIPTTTTSNGDQIYVIPDPLTRWINNNVMEEPGSGVIHTVVKDELVHAFSFEADPDDEMDVLPFYMTTSTGGKWHIEMVVVHQNQQGTVTKKDRFVIWSPYPHNDLDRGTGVFWSSNDGSWKEVEGSGGQGGSGWGGTETAAHVASQPFRIKFSDYGVEDENTVVYFQIYVDKGHAQLNKTGDQLTSITHKPNFVIIDLPPEFDTYTNRNGYNAMLVGAESSSINGGPEGHVGSDFDYNDVMFLLVGNIPDVYYDECLQEIVIKKRYMIEDLFDFDYDFNDIVIDVDHIEGHYYEIHEKDGPKTEKPIVYNDISYPSITQIAKFKYLCGTLPFQIKIGNKTFAQVTDPTDKDNTDKQLNGNSGASNKVTTLGSQTGINPDYTYSYNYQYSSSAPTILGS